MIRRLLLPAALLPLLALTLHLTGANATVPEDARLFRAGATVTDIAPQSFPVRVNGMFNEHSADKVVDPLTARTLALNDGTTRPALCVVDTCIMPRDLIDAAKKQASEATGIPVDPQLSLLAVETADGKPLTLQANYSMHYQSSPLLSSDYFGRFAVHIGQMPGAGEHFVGIMSQGTIGDLWSGDYSSPARPVLHHDAYAKEIAERVATAYRKIEWKTEDPLAMAQSTIALNYRLPDAERLQWAQEMKAKLGGRPPQSQAEIYALEAIHLHERRSTELILQALRVGDLGITALPNEVFCLTGLKLKARSPFPLTMNIELANGAEGYIPPPEQHALGGYTTWPARTAGLKVEAEPKIPAAVVALLEKVSGQPARREQAPDTAYARAVLAAKPVAFLRMEAMDAGTAQDSTGSNPAVIEPGVAVYLPGAGESVLSP
jgi:hypothetical protein